MSRRTHIRALGAGLALAVLAAAVPALAQDRPPARATIQTIGGADFKPNRFIRDTLRFSKDRVVARSGGKLTIRDKSRQPHTLSLVRRGQVPRKIGQIEGCFGGPGSTCFDLAVAHDAIDPETGEEKEPGVPLVNVGKAGFNQPGDSVFVPPRGKATVDVTAAKGKRLSYLCAVHPWMQGTLAVR